MPRRFEGNAGFFNTFGRGSSRSPTRPFRDLGRRWDLVEIGYSLKAYPWRAGRGHTAIESGGSPCATRSVTRARRHQQHPLPSVEVECASASTRFYPDRRGGRRKFSAAYVIALCAGARRARVSLPFTEAALKDERVKAVAQDR